MGRHIISNGENFFPKTHSRQIIEEGDKKSVEIVTKFHSDDEHSPTYRSSPSRRNLVQKQIERLYGDTLCQVTSPPSSDNVVQTSRKGRAPVDSLLNVLVLPR